MFTIPEEKSPNRSINWKELPCQRIKLPLFNPEHPDRIHYTDIVQGDIGSCWFLSVLISYLRPNAKNIDQRTRDLYKAVRLHKEYSNRSVYRVVLNDLIVYVDDYISDSYIAEIEKDSNFKCMWYILFEKSMLSLMTLYHDKSPDAMAKRNEVFVRNINTHHGEMRAATTGIRYLISKKCQCYCLHKKDQSVFLQHITAREIYRRFKNGDHVMANTHRMSYPGRKFPTKQPIKDAGGVPSHCYAITNIEYSKEKETYLITIQNPWGRKELAEKGNVFNYPEGVSPGKGISIITWERFHHLFACVHMTH